MSKIKLVRKIINAKTGEEIEREFTAEEYEQQKIDAQVQQMKVDKLVEAESKASAKSELLAKLGISEDELRLLIG